MMYNLTNYHNLPAFAVVQCSCAPTEEVRNTVAGIQYCLVQHCYTYDAAVAAAAAAVHPAGNDVGAGDVENAEDVACAGGVFAAAAVDDVGYEDDAAYAATYLDVEKY